MAAVALAPCQTIIWDGGFEDAEYRLRFVDSTGRPVPGVTLQVLTQAGGVCHLYPVNEFLPDSTPTSDVDGRMVFHHRAHYLEFGGGDRLSLIGVRLTAAGAPQYVLVFDRGGREVARRGYNELRPRPDGEYWTEVRHWHHGGWPAREILARRDEQEDARRFRLFDGDRNGILDREELVAARYFEWALQYRLDPDRAPRDVAFPIIEHAVVLPD
jgi:hypothetical protein